ncbi:MAG: Gfo/Idh/MocA family oxidoreductase [Anaerolineae bacterium]|nr:Gfo/Idh/MocA family oxidoreductase [Anaerolineae bacterium]
MLTFASGHSATFSSCAHAAWGFPFERIELYGEHASIVTEEMDRVLYTPGLDRETVINDYSRLAVAERWGYAEEDRLFVDAVLQGGPPPVTAEDGLRSVELVDAFYRSAEARAPVRLA